MNRAEIIDFLKSMATEENQERITQLIEKIKSIDENELEIMINDIGDEEHIKHYLRSKLQIDATEEFFPINNMFSYGIKGDCIHLHLPMDLQQMIHELGLKKTMDTVNLHLLDAIEKIRRLQNEGFYRLSGKDNIYMISPILRSRELEFLKELDFQTMQYYPKELENSEFIKSHPEAQLAIYIFGSKRKVGTAKIYLDVVNSEEWQEKRRTMVRNIQERLNDIMER